MSGLRTIWFCFGCCREVPHARCWCGREVTFMYDIDLATGGRDWPRPPAPHEVLTDPDDETDDEQARAAA